MHILVETLLCLLQCVWLWLVAIFRAVAPSSLLSHKDINGWTVLVTGAGSGIGRLMAIRFAGLGCHVVLWDISQPGNKTTAAMIEEAAPGAQVKAYTVDLSNREAIYQAAQMVKREVGDVDILVNNAGIVTGKSFLDSPDSLIDKTMEVNCSAHFWTVKSFLPAMLEKDRGHVVTIASSAGLFGTPGMVDYCASKFAAVGFDESLRGELIKQGKSGVKTTVVCPFVIDTGMFTGFKFRFPSLISYLQPSYVADKIIEAVLIDQTMLCIPKSIYVFYMLKGFMPVSVGRTIAQFMGTLDVMDEFVGRKKD